MTAVTEEIRLQIDRRTAVLEQARADGDEVLAAGALAQIEELLEMASGVAHAGDIHWNPWEER